MCVARVCRVPQLQWLTHCLDSLTPLPAPAKPAQQDPLVPALRAHQAHWTLLCPADLQIRHPSHGRHALPTSRPHRGPPVAWSRPCGATAATASLQKKTQIQQNHTHRVPDKVCWDRYSLSSQAPSESTAELQTVAPAGAWPAPPLSVPSVCLSVSVRLAFCVCLSVSLDVFVSCCFLDSPVSLSL